MNFNMKENLMLEQTTKQSESKKINLELKATLRRLSLKHRQTLMNTIVEQQEDGVFCIEQLLTNLLTSAILISPIKPAVVRANMMKEPTQQLCCLADYDVNVNLNLLPIKDADYPLYLECWNGKTQEVADLIHRYATILYSLKKDDLISFAQEVCLPDTEEEKVQKETRYKELEQKALSLHRSEYDNNPSYKAMFDMFYEDEKTEKAVCCVGFRGVTNITPYDFEPPKKTGAKIIGALLAVSAVATGVYCLTQNKDDNASEQVVPQMQKIMEQKPVVQPTNSRGAKTM